MWKKVEGHHFDIRKELLKYDNIVSGKYKTNFDIGVASSKFFNSEVKKYSHMWKDGGQFSTEKYNKSE